jgi:Transglutaminase-like superfamily
MKRLHRFLRLTAVERNLIVRTAFLMSAFRLGLWLLPFRRLASFARRKQGRSPQCRGTTEQVAWAVQVLSQYVPETTCLVQALTAKRLLGNAGYSARLYIGVTKGAAERFEAHAWVEAEDQVVVGGDPTSYTRLAFWEAEVL